MEYSMKDVQESENADVDTLGDLVLFRLANESNLPCLSSKFLMESHDIPGPGRLKSKKEAFNITLNPHVPVDQPVRLLTFGTDPQQCNILLSAEYICPIHCTVWAQLNSGPHVFVITSHSAPAVQYWDVNAVTTRTIETVVTGCWRATKNLLGLKIGPYSFSIHYPRDDAESRRLECWFREKEWVPVTKDMYDQQIGDRTPDWQMVGAVGEGANGQVIKKMEKHTGLVLAFKELQIKSAWQKQIAGQEIGLMSALKHRFMVQLLFVDTLEGATGPIQQIAMPLYLRTLASALPLPEMATTEQAMVQIIEGLRFMHENQVLHRDVKPENILINRTRPIHIRISDLGWATTFQNKQALQGACGTPGFAAPEVPVKIGMKSSVIQTTATDVYSMGATFYCMMHPDRRTRECQPELSKLAFDQPSKHYAGLIQAMMDRDFQQRPSLDECLHVVNKKLYHWTWTRCANKTPNQQDVLAPNPVFQSRPLRNAAVLQQQPQVGRSVAMPKQQTKIGKLPTYHARAEAKLTRNGLNKDPRLRSTGKATPGRSNFTGETVGREPLIRQQQRAVASPVARKTPPPPYENIFGNLAQRQPGGNVFGNLEQRQPVSARLNRAASVRGLSAQVPTGHLHANTNLMSKEAGQSDSITTHQDAAPAQEGTNHAPLTSTAQRQQQRAVGSRSRQPRHQVRRDAIGKKRKDNSLVLRQLRRHPARTKMVYRHLAAKQRKDQFCRGIAMMYRSFLNFTNGFCDTVRGACGFPCEMLGLVFNDLPEANAALRHINPEAGPQLNSERRKIYGLESHGCNCLAANTYNHERLESYLNWPNTEEAKATMSSRERQSLLRYRENNRYPWFQTSRVKQIQHLTHELPEPSKAKVTFREPVRDST